MADEMEAIPELDMSPKSTFGVGLSPDHLEAKVEHLDE